MVHLPAWVWQWTTNDTAWVWQWTTNDTAGVNRHIGPPFMAVNATPFSSNATVSAEPGSRPWCSLPASPSG